MDPCPLPSSTSATRPSAEQPTAKPRFLPFVRFVTVFAGVGSNTWLLRTRERVRGYCGKLSADNERENYDCDCDCNRDEDLCFWRSKRRRESATGSLHQARRGFGGCCCHVETKIARTGAH